MSAAAAAAAPAAVAAVRSPTTGSMVCLGACRRTDPLSLPAHKVLVQVLATSIFRGNVDYAAALVDALLALVADQQPGAQLPPALPCLSSFT
jgi:hypothetical protein